MTWHWLSFFVGAPIWGSLGMAFFAALMAAIDAPDSEQDRLLDRIEQDRRDACTPGIASLSEYRRRIGQPIPDRAAAARQRR